MGTEFLKIKESLDNIKVEEKYNEKIQRNQEALNAKMREFEQEEETKIKTRIALKNKQLAEQQELLIASLEKEAKAKADKYEFEEQQKIKQLLQSAKQAAEAEVKEIQDAADEEIKVINKELSEIKAKYDAINERLRFEREQKEKERAHRIFLSKEQEQDIQFLLSIENKITNKEILHKLIWSEYLQKPFTEMINNQFGSKIPKNVIYCIENIETNQKYIGKTSAEVNKRWTEHIKSSLSISTISHQRIHDALFANWTNFYFSIIEEVKDGKLLDREKYYINLYETNKYGYNMKE